MAVTPFAAAKGSTTSLWFDRKGPTWLYTIVPMPPPHPNTKSICTMGCFGRTRWNATTTPMVAKIGVPRPTEVPTRRARTVKGGRGPTMDGGV